MTISTSNNTAIITTTSGSMSQEIANILSTEYGVETMSELRSVFKSRTLVTDGLKLSERIANKERAKTAKLLAEDWNRYDNQEKSYMSGMGGWLIKSYKNVEDLRNQQEIWHGAHVSRLLDECDKNTRYKYAWAVARSLEWHGTYEENLLYKKVFVSLRMARLWAWTEVKEVEDLTKVILSHVDKDYLYLGTYGAWDWQIGSIVNLCRAGLSLQQINRFMGLVGGLRDANICISTANMQYASGFHFGDWISSATNGVRRNHVNLFNTFMRVYKHTHKISPKLSGRYLKVFETMDDQTLKFTATDSRNWSVNEYGSYYFRMAVVVKNSSDWRPIRKNHLKDQMWLTKFGRIPQDRILWGLPVPVINSFTKRSFGTFIQEYKEHEWSEHGVLALAKLYIWFGKGYKSLSTDTNCIHDLGIGLPETPFEEGRKFLMRYKHRWDEAVRIVNNWEAIVSQGINPLGKEGLKEALNTLMGMAFENVKDFEFAIECGKFITDQRHFERLQDIWINRDVKYESIPKVVHSNGDWKFYRLDRGDVRGPWLGEYTGCCQHPGGAGESCALHGTTNPDGAFVVLEHRGEIKFQSWVWRHGDALVFDNVEGSCKRGLSSEAKGLYTKGILAFKGRLGIKRILVGTGLGDMSFDDIGKFKKCPVPRPNGYSDANNVWELYFDNYKGGK